MENQESVELRKIFAVIWRRIWIVILLTSLAIVGILFFISQTKPVYEATVVLYIQPNPDSSSTNYNLIMAGEQLALTYSEVLKGQTVMQMVISQLGLNIPTTILAENMTVEPIKDTQLIKVSVRDESPEQASLIANTIANAFITQVQILQGERFAESLRSTQEKMDVENTVISELKKDIDSINAKGVGINSNLAQQELLLGDLRDDFRTLEKDEQILQLALSQLPDSVKISEGANEIFPSSSNVAKVTVMVGQPPAAEGTDFSMARSYDQLALTFSQMVSSMPVLEQTIQELQLPLTVEQLAMQLSAEPIPGTQLITITLNSSIPNQKIIIANTLAGIFVKQAQLMIAEPYNNRLAIIGVQKNNLTTSIEQAQEAINSLMAAKIQIDTDTTRLNNDLANHVNTLRTLQANYDRLSTSASNATDTVVIAEKANVPEKPIDHRLMYLIVAAGLGLVAGISLVFLLEQFEDRIRTRQDLNSTLGLTPLGTIGKLPNADQELIIDNIDPTQQIGEDFRILAINIRLLTLNKSIRRLLVASPGSQEGKSLITANLAVALVRTGLKVLVVDVDLRLPRLHQIFKCNQTPGLTDALIDLRSPPVLQPTKLEGLNILTSGYIPPDPLGIFNSPRFSKLLDKIDKDVDLVLYDSPAILSLADTPLLSTMVDGVVIVVRAGQTSSQDAKEAVARLQQANATIIGAVLNGVGDRSNYYTYGKRRQRGLNLSLRVKQILATFHENFNKLVKKGQAK